MCSFPTIKLSEALLRAFAASVGAGVASVVFARSRWRSFKRQIDDVALEQFGLGRANGSRLLSAGRGRLSPGDWGWSCPWRRRGFVFFRQGRPLKGAHAIHPGVHQDIYEHLDLG